MAWRRDGSRLTATGIAYDGQAIYVLDNGVAAKIPWAAVREWRWNIEGYSETRLIGGTAEQRLRNNVHNHDQKIDALSRSGFFVAVADVDKPEWQFTSADETVLRKWHEIFTQINEGRLAVSA